MAVAIVSVITAALLVVSLAYGHGTGSETLPPVPWGEMQATIRMDADTTESGVQVTLSMIRFDTPDTIHDTRMDITAYRGQQMLFQEQFWRPDGSIRFDFVNDVSSGIREITEGGFLGVFPTSHFEVYGPNLGEGGLYSLLVRVHEAGGYTPPQPVEFAPAVSVPVLYEYYTQDTRWGEQRIEFVTYYDELYEYGYDDRERTLSFAMPFSWDADIIEQIQTVHLEFSVPDLLPELAVSGFDVHLNDMPISDRIVTVEDIFAGYRTVHIVLPQAELMRMLEGQVGHDTMVFTATPSPDSVRTAVTKNGQYRILAYLDGDTLMFNITDVFLRNRPMAVPYQMEIHDGEHILYNAGISDDTGYTAVNLGLEQYGTAQVVFAAIDGNELANAILPVTVTSRSIPDWVRTTTGWWADGLIPDADFVGAISYMIDTGIIQVDTTVSGNGGSIPDWIRDTAGWWTQGQIGDDEFLAGVEYMVDMGIIP